MTNRECCNEFARFLEYLRDRGLIRTLNDAIAVVEKPTKWQPEYQQMLDARAREEEMAA